MMPNSSEIEYFLEVSSTLNISRAAERLGITQPTLSLAMQRLETSVGAPLLLRGKTGVRLTKAGARFASHAKTLIDQWERLRSEALSEESEVRGRFTIGCHPSVACYSVRGFAAELLSKNTELEVTFHHDLSRKITERVISFETDFGIVVNPVAHPDLRIVHLVDDQVTLWRGAKDFAKDVLICDPDLVQTQSLISKIKKASAAAGYEYRRVVHSSSLEVVSQLVACGAGVGILPTRVAQQRPEDKLRPLLPKGPVYEDKICLIYRPDAQKSLAAKTIMRSIEQSFRSPVN
jgi:DNA-binding transcriptional LysR family regulator